MTTMSGVPNASTHVLRVKLTGDNLFEFQAELYENCGSYDDAGTEVRTGRRVPILEPGKPKEPMVEFKTQQGGTVRGRRTMSFTEQEDYKRAMSEYRERKVNYKRHCNLLFLLITNSLSEAVLQRIRLQPEYRKLLSDSDVLGLWRLIKNIYMSVSGNSIAQLKTKWQGIHQIDAETGRVTPLKDHLTRIDGYVTLLNGFRNHLTMAQLELDEEGTSSEPSPITLESIPTERDFLLQLVNSLAPNRYTILTAPIITGAVTDKTYEQLKADLLKLEESGQLGPTNAGPPLIAMAKVFPSNYPKKEKGKRKPTEEKGNKESKKRRTKISVADPGFICYNCGLPGHYPKYCPQPAVKCTKCGRSRHLERFCKQSDGKPGKADAINTTARLVVETSDTSMAMEDDGLCLKLYDIKIVTTNSTVVQVDSGAGITIFTSVDMMKGKAEEIIPVTDTFVKGISGPSLKATHKGVCKAIGKFLIVPGLQDNLLSVPETTKQGLFKVNFDGDECVFTHKHLDTVPPIIVRRVANAYPMTMAQFDELLTVSYRAYCSKAEDEGTATPGLNEMSFSKEQTERAKEVRSLHYALLHPSDNSLIVALKNGLMLGTRLTESDVKNAAKILGPCIHCMAGKITRPTYTTSMAEPAKSVGAIVHCDLYCFKEPIIGNSKFALISLDEFSGYLSYYPLENKSRRTIQDNGFFKLVGKYKSFKKEITKIETDAEVTLASCEPFLGSLGIQLKQVPPYQHAQRIERYVRTIKDRIRCVLDQLVYELPSFLIGELIQAVIYWLNTIPNSLHPTMSPKVIMEGVKLDLNDTPTVPFGQVCMFHHAGRLMTNKREPRSELGIALGPSELTYNAVRCYLFKEKVVVIRSKYTLLDRIPTDFPFTMKKNRQKSANNLADYLFLKDSPRGLVPQHTAAYEDDMLVVEEGSDPLPAEPMIEALPHTEPTAGDPLISEPTLEAPTGESPESYAEDDPPPSIYSPELADFMDKMETADDSTSTMPPERGNIPMEVTDQVPLADHAESPTPEPTKSTEPSPPSRYPRRHRSTDWRNIKQTSDQPEKVFRVSVSDALNGPYAQQSREAIIEEIRNMLSYQVGHYVRSDQIPKRYRNNRIGCFMFLKHKKKPDGRYDRTKARMVSLGNRQRKHLYSIISSSTVSLAGVFLLMNYASYLKARIVTYDIKGAFLHAKFSPDDEPIYLTIGRDIASIWVTIDPSAATFLTEKGELILCLDRFIYGLKQSPYKFQQLLHQVLRELGYESCMHDECILVKRVKGGGISLLSTHVDDIFQVATHDSLIDELHAHLIKAFTQVTFNPKADAYLGMSINTSDDRHTIKLSQKGLVEEIIDKFLNDGYGSLSTPAEADLFDIDREADRIDASDNNFLSIVMSLMYLARLTRPDILLPVSYLASRAHCPTRQDYAKLGRIIRYLKGTIDDHVTIECDDLQLHCHCDASYGIHADGRSHTGYILSLGASHSYLHARSSKQKVTAISSTDAEILAVADGLKQIVWLRNLMREVDVEPVREVILYQDNRSSIWMLTEPTRYRRSKHILIKVSYIKEKCAEGAVKFIYLPTDQMNADLLTKPLQGELFRQLKRKIMRS